MLAADLAAALDPVRLAEAAGLTPDPWQAAVLRSAAPRQLLLCSRQSGKSSVTALLALHEAIYHPPALILILAPAQRQAAETFRRVLFAWRALGRPAPAEAESSLRLELENGSRIVALPGKEQTVRGYSGVRCLICDEASRIADELYAAIRPMLAVSAGRLVALTTPAGKRGWFYEAFEHGGPGWERVRIPASQCPRISASFLAEERRAIGDYWFSQEYDVEFRDHSEQLFSTEHVMAALSPEVRPLFAEASRG